MGAERLILPWCIAGGKDKEWLTQEQQFSF